MAVVDQLSVWLEPALTIHGIKLSYHIDRGGIYMKDAAVLAGLACIGKNNLLITPQFGSHQRLRVMLVDADLPSTGPTDYDPCLDCPMPCRKACPQQAFSKRVDSKTKYGLDALPGRSGDHDRIRCNRQTTIDQANGETIALANHEKTGRPVKYCRACELACSLGKKRGEA